MHPSSIYEILPCVSVRSYVSMPDLFTTFPTHSLLHVLCFLNLFIHSTTTKPSYRIIHIIIVVVIVVVVDIVNNSLTGSIPSELGNLVALNLTHIFVADNALTGDVPSDLRDIVYMNCIICARPRDVRGRGRGLELLDSSTTSNGQEKKSAASAVNRCIDLMTRFDQNLHMMTVDDCDELKEKCFVC